MRKFRRREVLLVLVASFLLLFAIPEVLLMWSEWKALDPIRAGIKTGISLVIAMVLLYVCFRYPLQNFFRRVRQRQKIVKMIFSNKYYETSNVSKTNGAGKSVSREKITYFPKFYYRVKAGYLYIRVPLDMSKFQDRFLDLEKTFENGLYCDLVETIMEDGYFCYTLLYDVRINRIAIEHVNASKGSILLMKNVTWDYDTNPHCLIAGGTGGGKSYFILSLIYSFLKEGAEIWICDPKNADLADLEEVLPNRVFSRKGGIMKVLKDTSEDMVLRWEKVKAREDYVTGENYAYYNLKPVFLVFDEYVAFMDMLEYKDREQALGYLKQLVLLGRQAGYFVVLAAQRPDAKYLADGIRDQFGFRVALGKMSNVGYSMMFGDADKAFMYKKVKGRGYADVGNGNISEFYSPLVPKGFKFIDEMKKLVDTSGAHAAPAASVSDSDQVETNAEGA